MNDALGAIRRSWIIRRAAACCLAAGAAFWGLSGCTSLPEYIHNGFKVGPNYKDPGAPLPEKWMDEKEPLVHTGNPNLASWWDVFEDPVLNDLIKRVHLENLTVRAAGAQIKQADELRKIALSELLPQAQTASVNYSRNMASLNNGALVGGGAAYGVGLNPAPFLSPVTPPLAPLNAVAVIAGGNGTGATTTGFSAGGPGTAGGGGVGGVGGANRFFSNVSTAGSLSWELDFWGLFRRNLEAANAGLDQSILNYDELVVIMLANLATQYVEIRTLQRRLELARKNVAMQEPLVKAYKDRADKGMANAPPGYFQLKSNLDNTKALIPPLEISLRQANNQLCELLGQPMQDLLPTLGVPLEPDVNMPSKRRIRIPHPVREDVVVGIPADILLKRPDVLAAERQLRIQCAQIGIAEAQLYPHIGINGTIGVAASNLPSLFSPNSWAGGIGPSLTWNILQYGRILANVRAQDYQFQQYVLTYQNAVLNANQDVENSIVAYIKTIDQAKYLRDSADAAVALTKYLYTQFEKGYLPTGIVDTSAFVTQVWTAVNFQVTQEDLAAQAEGNIALQLILLYRAMGGGWQIRFNQDNNGNNPACVPPAVPFPPTPRETPADMLRPVFLSPQARG